jgi:hypothetical protein
MRVIFFTLLIFSTLNLSAQKKLSFELNASVLHSVGKDISAVYHSDINDISFYYFSRKKFAHSYFNILGHITYSINPKIGVGLETGAYLHYLEQYFSNVERTNLSMPFMVTFSYKIININSNYLGIELAGGKIFYNIDEFSFKIKNGSLYNLSGFYNFSKRSTIKFGVEKEFDNVSLQLNPDSSGYQNQIYEYKLKRVSLTLSYCFKFAK